jgi:predicted AlkP superfamily pyrophosphatase or phosphodiesterase
MFEQRPCQPKNPSMPSEVEVLTFLSARSKSVRLSTSLGMDVAGAVFTFLVLALLLALTPAQAARRQPVTILVSIDGFRPDYLTRGVTPTLSRLARTGISGAMRPSFPTKTFPNHWTLVTGMRPDRHGIVGNAMEDPERPGELFTMATDDPFWWNAAEPIWVTAERQGVRSATMFWPGSNVNWGGTKPNQWPVTFAGGARPQDWQMFNQQVTGMQRVQAVLDWMRRPARIRPRLVTLYFDTVDTAGHAYGPDDARTTAAVDEMDALIGMLTAGLKELGQPANLVLVADHGMSATSSERLIVLDGLLDPAAFRVIESWTYAPVYPMPGREAVVEAALLKPHPHMQCWRKADIPARLHFGRNRRVAPILCLAETGWGIAKVRPARPRSGGDHGFDNAAPEMLALFVAHGPAFRRDVVLPVFDNVDVQPLIARLLGIDGGSVDGTAETFAPALRKR